MLWLMLLTLILATCRGGAPKKNQPSSRSFPSAEIPQILEEPQERMDWLVEHFWDRFLDPAVSEVSDSLHLNGITTDEVEKQVGMFTTLLQQAQPYARSRAMEKVFSLSEAYSQAHPASGMLLRLGDLLRKYLYDPSSPVRDEECYLSFITRLCASPLAESSMVPSYEWERNICLLNRPGSPAPDFAFTDLRGQVKTLYGIRSDYTVLIFGNPDCTACRQLMTAFREAPAIAGGIESGRLKVVDIFIDEDVAAWKAAGDSYPKEWINGYDHQRRIEGDRIYAVRAIPSIYLLDKDKTVLLKDAPEDRLMEKLSRLL